MSIHRTPAPHSLQQGLSLIELMIAMALGLILTFGVTQIFLGSSKTYRLSDELGKIQENSRYIFGRLQHEVRMGGRFGCLVTPSRLENHLDDVGVSYGSSETEFIPLPIIGWESQGTGLGDDFEIPALEAGGGNWSNGSIDAIPDKIENKMLPGTDFLVINNGVRAEADLTDNPNNGDTLEAEGPTGISEGAIVFTVTHDCAYGDLFKNTSGDDQKLSKDTDFDREYENEIGDEGGRIYSYRSTAYYIGEGARSEDTNRVPALFRKRLDTDDPPVELAEGVESMQILYGLSGGNHRRAESYVSAAEVTDWGNVVSVRIALLFRSDERVTDAAEQRTFNLAGTAITHEKADRRARVLGIATIGIRNMLE